MANDRSTAGDDCKRTIRVTRGRVRVNDGQHLHYFITCKGSTPLFSLACKHKTHFSADKLGPPAQTYRVPWLRSDADEEPGEDGEPYTFSMSFASAFKYTLRVELHDSGDTLVGGDDGIVVDVDYESDDPEMSCDEAWVVRTKPKE